MNDKERTLAYVKQWEVAGNALRAVHDDELRKSRYDWEATNAMLELGLHHARPRHDTGVVAWRQAVDPR